MKAQNPTLQTLQLDFDGGEAYRKRLAQALSDWFSRANVPGTVSKFSLIFYPVEVLPCCKRVTANRKFPNALYNHCKTYRHIACRNHVEQRDLMHVIHGGDWNALPSDKQKTPSATNRSRQK